MLQRDELKAIVENILLAANEPVTAGRLQDTLREAAAPADVQSVLAEIELDYAGRPLQVTRLAEGYQLCTRAEYGEWVKKYFHWDKSAKLSQPALDTLAIIAYKQPLTRAEVEEIRGVDSSGVVKTLLERKLIGPAGRKKVPGRPMMYQTTRKFLEYFGLRDLHDLPTLEDLREKELAGAGERAAPEQTRLLFDQEADEAADISAALPGDFGHHRMGGALPESEEAANGEVAGEPEERAG